MAITDLVVINLHAGTGAVTDVTANNITSTASGQLVADLVDQTNTATGVSLDGESGRTADTTGRVVGSEVYEQEMTAEGHYRTAASSADPYVFTVTLPSAHGPVDVRAYFATAFGSQSDIRVRVQGGADVGVDADVGGYAEFLSVSPDGSDQIVIEAWNGPSTFVFWNGITLDASASGGSAALTGTSAGTSSDSATDTATASLAGDAAGTSTDTATDTVSVSIAGESAGTSTDAATDTVGYAVLGTVTDGGTPEEGAEVYLIDVGDDSLVGSQLTDASGEYRFDGVPSGSYHATVYVSGKTAVSQNVTVG